MKPLVYKKSRTRAGAREPERHKLHITKGDTVRVISGEHRGKEGKVLRVFPKEFRVEVEGVNVVKKHKRAANPNEESGIIELTAPIAASKVMLLDPKSGEPTRVRRRADKDGTVQRIAVKSGQPIPHEIPKLVKIVLNVGMGDASKNPKSLEAAVAELGAITGQQPVVTRAKKAIANFNLREGMPVGCSVTLRGARMFEFLDRFITIAVPRMRDFRGLPTDSFDGRGNYTIGIKEQMIFPEIDYDKVEKIHGMDITFVTSAGRDDTALALLRELGMPFRGEAPVAVVA